MLFEIVRLGMRLIDLCRMTNPFEFVNVIIAPSRNGDWLNRESSRSGLIIPDGVFVGDEVVQPPTRLDAPHRFARVMKRTAIDNTSTLTRATRGPPRLRVRIQCPPIALETKSEMNASPADCNGSQCFVGKERR